MQLGTCRHISCHKIIWNLAARMATQVHTRLLMLTGLSWVAQPFLVAALGMLCSSTTRTDLPHLSAEARKVEHFTSAQLTDDHDYCTITSLSLFVSNVVQYISGWVTRKLSPQIACGDSVNALIATADGTSHTDSLLEIKNQGGIVKPSAGVVTVVKHAEWSEWSE